MGREKVAGNPAALAKKAVEEAAAAKAAKEAEGPKRKLHKIKTGVVTVDEAGRLFLEPTALETLREAPSPVCVLSVAGPAGEGTSTLANAARDVLDPPAGSAAYEGGEGSAALSLSRWLGLQPPLDTSSRRVFGSGSNGPDGDATGGAVRGVWMMAASATQNETAVDGCVEIGGQRVAVSVRTDGGGRAAEYIDEDVLELRLALHDGKCLVLRDLTQLVEVKGSGGGSGGGKVLMRDGGYGETECISALVQRARGDARPGTAMVTAREARRAMRVVEAMLASGGEWVAVDTS